MAHSTRGWTIYNPDFVTAPMSLKCDATTASNNGTSYTNNPFYLNFWPLHPGDLRHVYGLDSTKKTDSCVAMSRTNALFALNATFVDNEGNSYTVSGLRNERFNKSHLK